METEILIKNATGSLKFYLDRVEKLGEEIGEVTMYQTENLKGFDSFVRYLDREENSLGLDDDDFRNFSWSKQGFSFTKIDWVCSYEGDYYEPPQYNDEDGEEDGIYFDEIAIDVYLKDDTYNVNLTYLGD